MSARIDDGGASVFPQRTSVAKDAAALFFLAIAGTIYFHSYHDYGFNIADEGSVLLITMRLLEGERPFLDLATGYGLLWYYPIVLLFMATGVSFIAIRAYFMSMALATALMAFLVVRAQTRCRELALAIALLILMIPGTLHKTYVPFIIVANMLLLSWLGRNAVVLGNRKIFGSGLVVGISYHVRHDLGVCAFLALMTTLGYQILSRSQDGLRKLSRAARMTASFSLAVLVATLPLVLVAYIQGFLGAFLSMPAMLARILRLARCASGSEVQGLGPEISTRIPVIGGLEEDSQRVFTILAFLPWVFLLAVVVWSIAYVVRRDGCASKEEAIRTLAFLGLAYSAFPQFFFFRPDVAHLSQFMPGYLVFAGIFLGRRLLLRDTSPANCGASGLARRRKNVGSFVLFGIAAIHVALYATVGMQRPIAGSIALARGRSERFQAANGIDVAVTPGEKILFSRAVQVIEENSEPDDFVLCFPYAPGFNVMANRKTFAQKLYVDDRMLIRDPSWQKRMVEQIKTKRPALIIVQDVAVNGTEISRFQNWATLVMEYVASEYVVVETLGTITFYGRRRQSS